MVAQEFCENYNKECVVMHLDNNPSNNEFTNLKCGTQKENITQCHRENRAKPKVKINQYDLEGNFIKHWESEISIHNELGYNINAISNCLTGFRKRAYGCIWRYADNE